MSMHAGGTQVEQQQQYTHRLQGGFQREEIDAAHRAATHAPSNTVDERGVAVATASAARLVEAFPESVTGWSVWRSEVTLQVRRDDIVEVATYVRDELGFALLSDISPCDRLGSAQGAHPARFSVSYHVTQLEPGAPRLTLQLWAEEGESVPSVMGVWPTADWHEREGYDFFGIEFSGRAGLKRLIMPDDWVGHPLRKDYPIGGEPVKFTNAVREI